MFSRKPHGSPGGGVEASPVRPCLRQCANLEADNSLSCMQPRCRDRTDTMCVVDFHKGIPPFREALSTCPPASFHQSNMLQSFSSSFPHCCQIMPQPSNFAT